MSIISLLRLVLKPLIWVFYGVAFLFVFTAPGLWASLASAFVLPPLLRLALTTLLAGAVLYWLMAPKKSSSNATFGTAEWGDDSDMKTAKKGLILGRSLNPKFRLKNSENRPPEKDDLLRFSPSGHLLTVAKTRSGKGVGSVIPNLLKYPGSVVVTDLKGENFAVAQTQRVVLGQQIAGLDPFDTVGGLAHFNPLDLIDTDSDDAIDDVKMIADALIIPSDKGKESHWDKESHALISGLLLYICQTEPESTRNLAQLRHVLTQYPDDFKRMLNDMLDQGGLVRRSASRLLGKDDREYANVLSSAQSHTHFLDSPRMERVTAYSSFDLDLLKSGDLSLFLILPPDRLDSYRGWLRLMISCSLLSVVRSPGKPEHNVLFLLDEFANLGRMESILRGYSLLAGYGASMWIFLQNLSQLKQTYSENWQTFIGNTEVLQSFGTKDKFTAEYLSDLAGQQTVHSESKGKNKGSNQSVSQVGFSSGKSLQQSETGRQLIMPDEIIRMDEDHQLLFVGNNQVVKAQKVRYYEDSEFAGLFDENPQYEAV